VTDAVGGFVHVRVLLTAKDAPTLFDLRCYVRENLVAWIQREATAALPRRRVELVEAQGAQPSPRSRGVSGDTLFSGSTDAEHRASQFTDSIPVVPKVAAVKAERHRAEDADNDDERTQEASTQARLGRGNTERM